MAGYSGTPLARKLGIRDGSRVTLLKAPPDFASSLEPLPDSARVLRGARGPVDLVVCFSRSLSELRRAIAGLKARIVADGGLWIAWPKKASGVPTDLTFNEVQRIGLEAGLVDIKVCAIDEIWSALRFVYRVEDRAKL